MRTRIGPRLIAAALLLASACSVVAQTMRAHFLDVGQGSAAILESECAAVLIDTGGELNNEFDSTQMLVDQIEDFFFGRPHLDRTFQLFVLTHPHIDHTRGVNAVLEKYTVLNAVTNGQEASSGKPGQKALHRAVALSEQSGSTAIGFEPIRVVDLPTTGLSSEVVSPIACGTTNPKITALWGTSETSGWSATDAKNQNNHSVVLRVDFGNSSMLLTGDLEERGIAGLLAKYKDTGLLDVDVYLVGHHGAANATTDALLRAVTPKIAVISMGVPDRMTNWTAWAYGHPRKVIVQQLLGKVSETRPTRRVSVATGVRTFEQISISRAIFATGWDGTIVLEADVAGGWSLVSDRSLAPGPRKLNVNTASADELDTLPMIGLNRARQIIAFRQANGPFGAVDDLKNVPGIGDGTMKAIRHLIEVR